MSSARRTALAVCLAVVPLVVYPFVALRGNGPSFPSPEADCAPLASPGETAELELVYGRFADFDEAERLRNKVVAVGFVGTEVREDGCGLWKVVYDGVEDYANGASVVAEARKAGFDPHLEIAPG